MLAQRDRSFRGLSRAHPSGSSEEPWLPFFRRLTGDGRITACCSKPIATVGAGSLIFRRAFQPDGPRYGVSEKRASENQGSAGGDQLQPVLRPGLHRAAAGNERPGFVACPELRLVGVVAVVGMT